MSNPAILTVIKNGETLKSYPVQGELVLGRAEDCVIHLDDRAVSRHHALFKSTGDSLQVEKKSEFAPLAVNGIECTRAVLKEGDVVTVGPYSVRISISSTSHAHSASPSSGVEAPKNEENKKPDLGASPPFSEGEMGEALVAGNDPNGFPLEEALPAEVSSEQPFEVLREINVDLPLGPEQSPDEMIPDEPIEPMEEDGKTKITPSSGKINVKLIFKVGTANVTEFEMTQDEVSIGRGKDCDIILNDKKASRKNSIIRKAGLNFIIKDLNSSNGTFVNGVRVNEQELSGDDRIKIGSIEFQFMALSLDYLAKEKNFMSLLPEAEIPDLPQEVSAVDPLIPASFEGGGDSQALAPNFAQPGITPGLGNIAGITGMPGSSTGKKKTLLEKFKALPKRTQIPIGIAVLALLYWASSDDETPSTAKKANSSKKNPAITLTSKSTVGLRAYENLNVDEKQFVNAQHDLAFSLYKNKDYDKAIFEIQKIFTMISDYKDSREIERYAKEGKRKTEAIEEERKQKEEEANLKKKIAQLVDETKQKMDKKQYDQAKDLFSQVLSLDPDNMAVANWRKEIETFEEQTRIQEQQKQVQIEINKHGWELFIEANQLKKLGKYHGAIEIFQKCVDIGASDTKLIPLAKKMIQKCHAMIRYKRDPVLSEAKKAEESGDFSKAFALYKKAIQLDPPHPAGYAGINRIKGVLHDRAKAIYTEAILAESYSDFTTAKKLYQECLTTAPTDDIYHERAQRKLAHYFRKEETPP